MIDPATIVPLHERLATLSTKDPIHRYLLSQVYQTAHPLSDDPRTKNGAMVFVPHLRGWVPLSKGSNRLHLQPAKADLYPQGCTEALKGFYLEHAERNAIFEALNVATVSTLRETAILVCPWFACADCARAIAAVGPRVVIGHRQVFEHYDRVMNGKWRDQIEHGHYILSLAGIRMYFYDGDIVDDTTGFRPAPITVAGTPFQP